MRLRYLGTLQVTIAWLAVCHIRMDTFLYVKNGI